MALLSPVSLAPCCSWLSPDTACLGGPAVTVPFCFHLFPSHLDNHSLWEPKIFATRCFRIIMYSIQVGSWGDSCQRLGLG